MIQALGALEQRAEIAAAGIDAVGLRLEEENLPKRIRYPRAPTPEGDDGSA